MFLTPPLEILIVDHIQDHVRFDSTENILGIIRIKFQNINLKSLKHDVVLIPRNDNIRTDKLNLDKASLLNSKIGRNEDRIYRASLIDFERQKEKAIHDIENFECQKDIINKEIIDIVNKIKGLNWKDTDIKQEGKLKETDAKIDLVEKEIVCYNDYIERVEKEESAFDVCDLGAVHVGLEYKKINEEVLFYLFSATCLAGEDPR